MLPPTSRPQRLRLLPSSRKGRGGASPFYLPRIRPVERKGGEKTLITSARRALANAWRSQGREGKTSCRSPHPRIGHATRKKKRGAELCLGSPRRKDDASSPTSERRGEREGENILTFPLARGRTSGPTVKKEEGNRPLLAITAARRGRPVGREDVPWKERGGRTNLAGRNCPLGGGGKEDSSPFLSVEAKKSFYLHGRGGKARPISLAHSSITGGGPATILACIGGEGGGMKGRELVLAALFCFSQKVCVRSPSPRKREKGGGKKLDGTPYFISVRAEGPHLAHCAEGKGGEKEKEGGGAARFSFFLRP